MSGDYSYYAWRLKNKITLDKKVDSIMNQEVDPYTNLKNPVVDGLKIGPDVECSYEEALEKGLCFYCQQPLKWELNIPGGVDGRDDRCCFARCCGKVFAMVPTKVRILETTESKAAPVTMPPLDDENYEATDRGYYDMSGYNSTKDFLNKKLDEFLTQKAEECIKK